MPKIKVLCRNPDDFLRETKNDIHKVPRSRDPSQHPFQKEREYTRALNAVKLERTFAKPFLGALDGHRDGVKCLLKHPSSLALMFSGSSDGEIISWNLPQKKCIKRITAHEGEVYGMTAHRSGRYFFSCGSDKTIKQWTLSADGNICEEPVNTRLSKQVYTTIDHHWQEDTFVTGGSVVHIWDEKRSEPIRAFPWGQVSINHVRFNPVETYLLGACASDRNILLYDSRASTALRKVTLKLCSNALAWNPMEAFHFTVANEDYNLYTFDVRKLSEILKIHRDHTAAVMDLDYSPTGREFVSAGYDKVIRIYPITKEHSREVYHTKRMQRVSKVLWSRDSKYIVSASDEMNIRLWKAVAWEKLGKLGPREKAALNYSEALKRRYEGFPQISRIKKHRRVPKHVYTALQQNKEMAEASKRREERKRAHSKPGSVPKIPAKKQRIVGEVE